DMRGRAGPGAPKATMAVRATPMRVASQPTTKRAGAWRPSIVKVVRPRWRGAGSEPAGPSGEGSGAGGDGASGSERSVNSPRLGRRFGAEPERRRGRGRSPTRAHRPAAPHASAG